MYFKKCSCFIFENILRIIIKICFKIISFNFKDGTYKKSVNDKLTYGTMIFVRVVIVRDLVSHYISKAAVIATRYSCVRRQSELKPG